MSKSHQTTKALIKDAIRGESGERLARPIRAAFILGCEQVVFDCITAGWLAPKVKRHRMTLYSVADLNACADRIEAGEYPGK